MKNLFRLFPTFLLSLLTMHSISQGGPKWSEGGNAVTSSSFLGTTNAQSLFFRTNNLMRFYISASGDVILPMLSGVSNGFAILDNSGKIAKLNFSGSATDVFFGNGTWGSISSASGWTYNPGFVSTTNKVGIGVPFPAQALEVQGNIIANGIITAEEFNAGNVVNAQQSLRVSTTLCLKGYNPTLPGSRSEICGIGNDFYIQSNSFNNHTILNYSNLGNVGIGTNNPTAKLHVNGSLKVDGESYHSGKSHFSRISGMPGDSLILFGDSTIVFNHASNRIYTAYVSDPVGGPFLIIPSKGLGIGSMFATAIGNESVAMGRYAKANANNSIAIGSFVSTSSIPFDLAHNIVLGRGISSTQPLNNPIRNSLMVGFNSNIPTLFVSESAGLDATGTVCIATTDVPVGYKLAVNGKIISEEVKVLLKGFWPDYVFEPTYNLTPLPEVKKYYIQHKHLNGVPSAKEVDEGGISLGEMNAILLKKIEENTLYMVQMSESLEFLKTENTQMKKEIEQLKLNK